MCAEDHPAGLTDHSRHPAMLSLRARRSNAAFQFLLLVRRFEYVHATDQSPLEPIPVADAGVGDELACAGIVDHLVNIDRDAAVGLLGEAPRFDCARDRGELPLP